MQSPYQKPRPPAPSTGVIAGRNGSSVVRPPQPAAVFRLLARGCSLSTWSENPLTGQVAPAFQGSITATTGFSDWFSIGRVAAWAVFWGVLANGLPTHPACAADGGRPRLDERRAFGYLVSVCRFGPRPSGSRGMAQQQKLIVEHFSKLKATVRYQSFDAPHPLNGTPVRMNNIVVSWHPESRERVLLACHYDTRPFPDEDRRNARGPFIGANDGASGVALLMELAHQMPSLKTSVGVDFVFFDAEEFVFGNRGKYFIGSEHFAAAYRDRPESFRYLSGVVVDMVADRRLNLYKEKNSVKYAQALTDHIWAVAKRLDIREFIDREQHEVSDDHLPLNTIAKIPTCDIIDFDYPYWHTMQDLPSRCSGQSLVKVGRVLLEWLESGPFDFSQPEP